MVKIFSLLFLSVLCVSCTNINITTDISQNYILKFKENTNYPDSIKYLNKNNLVYSDISKELKIFELKISKSQKNILALNEKIEYLSEDQKMNISAFKAYNTGFNTKAEIYEPNDTLFRYQWNISNAKADSAWLKTIGDKNITVAVIDSGVDPNHPDLKNNLLPLIDIWSETGREDIYNYKGTNIDYKGKDGNGHGTHVTGILGAIINDNEGIAGIAGNIKVLPIKASNHLGETYSSTITKAIIRAIDEKVRVINISIGGPKSEGTKSLYDAVELAVSRGVLFVSATGNESDRKNKVITDVTVPAAYPGVLSVGAITRYDKVANYSNGGNDISLVAPGGGGLADEGEKIYSTFPTYKTYLSYAEKINGPYALFSGTSMAAPHVAGAAALILSREPNLTYQQLRVRILSSATFLNAKGFDPSTGYGKLNIEQALNQNTDDKRLVN